MSLMECNSISEFLGAEFSRRKQRNTSYSLRAFARDLKISPSRLSEVIKGQQGLAEASIDTIAKAVTSKVREQRFLKDLVLAEHSRNAKVREAAQKRLEEQRKSESVNRLREDQVKLISDWHHGAILELTQVAGFKADLKWISEQLGVTVGMVEAAVRRLESMGLMENWVAKPEAYGFISELPSGAISKFHMQILSKHIESLREDSPETRAMFSMIVAIPKHKLPDFKEDMQKFITQFWQKIENEPKDDLYSMSLQLCPVRNRRPEEKS